MAMKSDWKLEMQGTNGAPKKQSKRTGEGKGRAAIVWLVARRFPHREGFL
jgi:hypothetical protein